MQFFVTLLMKLILFAVCISLIPGILNQFSVLGLLFIIAGLCLLFAPVRSTLGWGFAALWKLFFNLLGGILWVLAQIFKGLLGCSAWILGISKKSMRFMGWIERWGLLNANHQGVLVDGRSARLSESASYENLMVQGGVGRGKTSTFVLPNLLSPPKNKPSFVITDTSGELYQSSSGYLNAQGYQIRVLNLMDLSRSETYNPMKYCIHSKDLADLAHTLVQSAQGSAGHKGDPFWNQAAEKLIRILGQCLMNMGDPAIQNLANLRHLITQFDAHLAPQGQLGKIDQFVLQATQQDPLTFASYQAFVQGNLKTIQSILMSADVALDPLATPEIATLTAEGSFQFQELRDCPTALYVMVNQTQMDLFRFLLNLFYADLFKALLKDPHNPGNPVWLFLDEFGHLQVNGFEVFATTARKYKVSYALFLQSLAQLEARYGVQNAKTVLESLGSEIYLPGMSLEVAQNLEARLGRDHKAPLMAAHEIIRMKEHQALMLYSNRLPILLKTKRYYQRIDLRMRANKPPAPLPNKLIQPPTYLKL